MAELANFTILQLTLEHAIVAGVLPLPHRDPFDRLLAAQAILDGYTMLSTDLPSTDWARRGSGKLTAVGEVHEVATQGPIRFSLPDPPPGAARCASPSCR